MDSRVRSRFTSCKTARKTTTGDGSSCNRRRTGCNRRDTVTSKRAGIDKRAQPAWSQCVPESAASAGPATSSWRAHTSITSMYYRPPDMSVELYFTSVSSSFFLFFRRLIISELAERNSTKIGHIDNRSSALTTTKGLVHRPKMSQTLVHQRLKSQPAFFSPSVNSEGRFKVRNVSYIVQKFHELVYKRLKTGPDFLLTLTILFRSSPSHTL